MIHKRNSAFVITVALIGSVLTFSAAKLMGVRESNTKRAPKIATLINSEEMLAAFTLTSTSGMDFSPHSLKGKWTLLFFGYPKCPDVCPKTLSLVRESWKLREKQRGAKIQFVFADISPKQTPTLQLQQFVQNYHQDFLGISGSKEQMHKLSDQLGIYSKQQDNVIDHTAALMLIDPQGKLHAIFTPPFSAEDLVHDLNILAL